MKFPTLSAFALTCLLAGVSLGCGGGGGGGGGGAFVPNFLAADLRVDPVLVPNPYPSEPSFAGAGGGLVYAAWSTHGGAAEIDFSRSTDGGLTWSAPVNVRTRPAVTASAPLVTCDGLNVCVAWANYDYASPSNTLLANASSDGGVTWMPSDVRADAAGAAGVGVGAFKACRSGANVNLVWTGNEGAPTGTGVYVSHSSDGGATWGVSDTRLDPLESDTSLDDDLGVAADGARVYVVWVADTLEPGSQDYIGFQTSSDGGATWLPAAVSVSGAPGGAPSEPRVAASGAEVHVVWTGTASSIESNASHDRGATWAGIATLDSPAAHRILYDPEVSCSGLDVNVVYNEDLTDYSAMSVTYVINVRVAHSPTGGGSWGLGAPPLDAGSHSAGGNPVLSVSGTNVFAIWLDTRNATDFDLYFNYSRDGGATWAGSDVRMSTSGPVNSNFAYALLSDGSRVFVGWLTTGSPAAIRCNASVP